MFPVVCAFNRVDRTMMNKVRTALPSSFRRVRNVPPSRNVSYVHSTAPITTTIDSYTPTFLRKKHQAAPSFQSRSFVSVTTVNSAAAKKSPFDDSGSVEIKKKGRRKFIPPKAAVKLTPKARDFFKLLLEKPPRPDIIGIMLNYNQASSGQPRMVFSFDFVTADQIADGDEGVSLELLEDETPKPPKDSLDDGLPKLYVNHNGFMKVLGCKLDVDTDNMKPILYDPSGNVLDPNV